MEEESGKHLGGIWEHLGGIWEASRNIEWLGSILSFGGSFTIVKMQPKRRDRPFYRRVAKVGGTKYRKTHGFRAEASRGNAPRQAAVGQSCQLLEIPGTRFFSRQNPYRTSLFGEW